MDDGSLTAEDWNVAPAETMLDRALDYAVHGVPVFPCVVGGKKPACANGYKDATTDPARIRELWSDPNRNIGMCPEQAGLAVVDLDIGKGKDGIAAWHALSIKIATHTVRTPGGGRHLYYRGSLPSTVGKLAAGIDTRGIGG